MAVLPKGTGNGNGILKYTYVIHKMDAGKGILI
jgi:hypothetical protein